MTTNLADVKIAAIPKQSWAVFCKRCAHFTLRRNGKGMIKLYSQYYVSLWCGKCTRSSQYMIFTLNFSPFLAPISMAIECRYTYNTYRKVYEIFSYGYSLYMLFRLRCRVAINQGIKMTCKYVLVRYTEICPVEQRMKYLTVYFD